MRKLVILISFFVISNVFAHVNAAENNLFACMDKKTFAINSVCTESVISNNIDYKEMEMDFADKIEFLGGNVMATINFYPKEMKIDVIANRDALDGRTLLAKNTDK